jgi:diguanylate cyclase (GGDEF)-like protein
LPLLHIPSLLLTTALLFFIMPAVTYLVLNGRRQRAVTLWCGGDLLLGLSMVLFALRGQAPEWVTFAFANVLMFVGVMMRIQSLRRELGRPLPLILMVAAVSLFMLGFEGIRLGLRNDLLRLQFHHAVFAVLFTWLAALGWRIAQQEQSRGARWIGGVYLLLAVSFLHSVIGLSLGRVPPVLMDANSARIFTMLAGILTAVIACIGYVGLAFERSRRQAIQADQEYRAIIATSLDGFFLCDRDGRFLDVNQAYCDLIGYRREELLTNRRLLDDRLGQVRAAAHRSGCYGALLLLDLDNFKPLNDTYGHAAGDLLLIEVARRLTLTLRAADTAARLGGDEFVLLIGDLSTDEADAARQVGRLTERVRRRLSAPYRLNITRPGHADTVIEHHCTASLGVTLFNGKDGTAEDIFRQADLAMYQAKANGRDQARVYDAAGAEVA